MYIKKYKLKIQKHKKIIIILILGIIIRSLFLFRPFSNIFLYFSDDAYYYFVVVKNFINGKGIVFNSGIPTNGFHPLYFLLLVPLFYFFYPIDPNLPIFLSLIILTCFDLGTAYLLFKIGENGFNQDSGFILSIFWLYNPFIILTSYLGLESSIQIFFISFLIFYITEKKKLFYSRREALFISLIFMFLIFSRLDGIFILSAFILFLFLKKFAYLKKINPKFKIKNTVLIFFQKDILIILSFPFAFILLWMTWSLTYIGLLIPTSSQGFLGTFFTSDYFNIVFNQIKNSIAFILNLIFYPSKEYLLQLILFILVYIFPVGYFLYKNIIKKRSKFLLKLIYNFGFLIFALILYLIFYWLIIVKIRPWYAHFINFIFIFFYCMILINLIESLFINKEKYRKRVHKIFKKNYKIILTSSFLLIFFLNGLIIWNNPYGKINKARLIAANYIDENLPKNAKIGSFNTGIIQYYTENHDIINLDGFINTEAYFAKKDNKLEDYIIKINITYIIDPISYVQSINGTKLLLNILYKFEVKYDSGGIYRLYLFNVSVIY